MEQLYIQFGIIIVLALILALFGPQIKGYIGEKQVLFMLKRLKDDRYRILEDIIIPKGDSTSQIDHLVIGPTGIIVIETKNYKGWIFGSEKAHQWTQTIYKNKYKFLNPIIQNKGHIKALQENLAEFSQIQYHSIIVLAGSGIFKTPEQVVTPVIYPWHIKKKVLSIAAEKELNQSEVHAIYLALSQSIIGEKGIKRQHVKNVVRQQMNNNPKQAVSPVGLCPKCGSNLVKKKGKFGGFMGCESYPNCKYTKKIEERG